MAKPSYYTETRSSDISFCMSDCKRVNCSRNTKGELFKNTCKAWYSVADFRDSCKDYIK